MVINIKPEPPGEATAFRLNIKQESGEYATNQTTSQDNMYHRVKCTEIQDGHMGKTSKDVMVLSNSVCQLFSSALSGKVSKTD